MRPGTTRSIVDYLEPRLATYTEELRELCAIDSKSGYRPGISGMARWIESWVRPHGWSVATIDDDIAGPSLVVTLPCGGDGPRILLAAHMDTVYPVGTAAERPLVLHGDSLIGPGTADNKSGLLSGLYAMAALQDLDLLRTVGAITLLCGSDEEVAGMPSSGSICDELAMRHDRGLVLECAGESGEIVSCRKGMGTFTLHTVGRAAHAGVEPERGANAIVGLARQIDHVSRLDGFRPGVTVNVTTVTGGTATNVIPDEASACIDVRVEATEDMEPVVQALRGIATMSEVPDTVTELLGGWHAPPMPFTPSNQALAQLAMTAAHELGFETMDVRRGGTSYANRIAARGLPVLDGLAPIGGNDHSPDEYILRSSIVPRTALLALVIGRSGGRPAGSR